MKPLQKSGGMLVIVDDRIKVFDFKIYTNAVYMENKSIQIYHLGMKIINISTLSWLFRYVMGQGLWPCPITYHKLLLLFKVME